MAKEVIIQYFEWYLPHTPSLWLSLKDEALNLKNAGFDIIWMPPAYKCNGGVNDVGYGVYDVYDLGEFDAKETIPTKYGTREEYLSCIEALHDVGLQVMSDIVLNHKMGADGYELVVAKEINKDNRFEVISEDQLMIAYTLFTFPARHDKYSDFHWHWYHFDGVDYDVSTEKESLYLFDQKEWQEHVDDEHGNFDYLMGADLDFTNQEVIDECVRWGKWYLDTCHNDAFRLDAVKHIEADFYEHWLKELRDYSHKPLLTVGEYWNGDLQHLIDYLEQVHYSMTLFDVPLHFHMYDACHSDGNYDMGSIFEGTLVKYSPDHAVTFVDNHDTQPSQDLQSYIDEWFMPMAYALILLREEGYPCVFYGDYYGIPHDEVSPQKEMIDGLLRLRERMAGKRYDYFDHHDLVGWSYEGHGHKQDGFVVLMTNARGGMKRMKIGRQYRGLVMSDGIHHVVIDEHGYGNFVVDDAKMSIYVKTYKKFYKSRRSRAWRKRCSLR